MNFFRIQISLFGRGASQARIEKNDTLNRAFFLIGKRIVSKRRNHQHLISNTDPTHVIVALTLAIQENNNLFKTALRRRERNECILCLKIENFLELAAGLHQTRHCYHWLTPDTSSSSQTARAVLNRKKGVVYWVDMSLCSE